MLLRWIIWSVLLSLVGGGARAVAAGPANSSDRHDAVSSSALGEEPVRGTSAPSAATAPAAGAEQSQGMDYPRVLGSLALVIGLIFLLRWFGKVFFPGASGRSAHRGIEVLSRSPVSARQHLMLVRIGRRLVVVGDSGAQMNPICEITDPDEVAELMSQMQQTALSPARSFAGLFGRSQQTFESDAGQAAAESDRPADDPPVESARQELGGLRERVRLLAEQFKVAEGEAR